MTSRDFGRLSRWLVRSRVFLRLFGGISLAAVLVLCVPGNPFLDVTARKYRDVATILSHAATLSLALGFVGERHRWLEAAAGWSPARAVLTFGLVGVSIVVALVALAQVWPAYVRLLLWESGPLEPVEAILYLVAAWIASVHAALLRARGVEYRPYRLVMAGCIALMLEEVDYFGVFGNVLGRIDGTYIGAPHDLLKLVPDHPLLGIALLGAVIGVLVALWRFGFLTGSFIRREALDLSSGPLYVAAVFLALAQADDLHIRSVAALSGIFKLRVEEPLELLGAMSLCLGLLMKYSRDRRYASAPSRSRSDRTAR
ncbi:MAG TPA: hypothetical protein VFO18_16770 [Methylomirabilota bacterium]|nr:hypothetical protein [Methylomirabilota bacterium]